MNPIITLGIVAVAAAATGIGFLNNVIDLNIQQLGVGEEDLVSPFATANIDLQLKTETIDPTPSLPNSGDETIFNAIEACSFHTPDAPDASQDKTGAFDITTIPPTPIPDGDYDEVTIVCKLTDGNDKAIAEGTETFLDLSPSETVFITINEFAFGGSNDVQLVHDVKIVAKGIDPTP